MIDIYPGARWVPADPSNYRVAHRETFQRIVIHCTDGRPHAAPVAAMWQQKGHGSSAHFVIGQDGEVIQAVKLQDIAYHAHLANRVSVGIEHCCRTPRELGKDDPGLPPTEAQLMAGAQLVAWLCRQAGLSPSRAVILGHAEADPKTTHTGCPTSAGINLDAYVQRVCQITYATFA